VSSLIYWGFMAIFFGGELMISVENVDNFQVITWDSGEIAQYATGRQS
jgi:hypothetical protein